MLTISNIFMVIAETCVVSATGYAGLGERPGMGGRGHLRGEDLLPGGSLTSHSPHFCPEKDRDIGGLRADSESEGPQTGVSDKLLNGRLE